MINDVDKNRWKEKKNYYEIVPTPSIHFEGKMVMPCQKNKRKKNSQFDVQSKHILLLFNSSMVLFNSSIKKSTHNTFLSSVLIRVYYTHICLFPERVGESWSRRRRRRTWRKENILIKINIYKHYRLTNSLLTPEKKTYFIHSHHLFHNPNTTHLIKMKERKTSRSHFPYTQINRKRSDVWCSRHHVSFCFLRSSFSCFFFLLIFIFHNSVVGNLIFFRPVKVSGLP